MRVKRVVLRQGDDLRAVASRELGDAARWSELARLNGLRLPFVVRTFSAEERLPGTLVWGDVLLAPWERAGAEPAAESAVFGADVALIAGRLEEVGGDLVLVEGRDNLVQALGHRIETTRGELTYHPEYGCNVAFALGLPAGPFANLAAGGWVHEALVEEPRLAAVRSVTSEVSGDALRVSARVEVVGENTPVDLNLVLAP